MASVIVSRWGTDWLIADEKGQSRVPLAATFSDLAAAIVVRLDAQVGGPVAPPPPPSPSQARFA